MKKMLLVALATLLAVPAFSSDADDAIYSSSNGVVRFDIVNYIGFGYHSVKTADFKPNFSSEFFFNVLQLGIYPAEVLGIELNLDCKFSNFNSKTSVFSLNEGGLIQAADFSSNSDIRSRSGFNVFSLSTPVLLKGVFGDIQLGVGAEASFNLTGDVYHNYKEKNVRTRREENKAKVSPFSYGLLATLSYKDFGVYFKYYPKGSRLLPEGSVDLNYMTVGVALGF